MCKYGGAQGPEDDCLVPTLYTARTKPSHSTTIEGENAQYWEKHKYY